VIGSGFNEVCQSGPREKIVDTDPDPGGLNDPKKLKNPSFHFFEVLDVLSEGPMASTLAQN
jgi:hypothetical protein